MAGVDARSSHKSSSRAWEALTPSLSEWILDATSSLGFSRMTPVQGSTIPLFMGNKDVVVEAVTGSGKTLAFLIPVVERLLRLEEPIKRHHVGAIIVSPTRELASQIHAVLLSLLAFHGPSARFLEPLDRRSEGDELDSEENPTSTAARSASKLEVIPQLLLGGSTTPAQDLSWFLKNSPNLLIATPGRLLELLSSPHVHCPQSSFEVLVLDEADRLLDLGFKDDLQKILQRLPKQRRTGLFSASVSEAVDQLVRVGLRNPVKVAVKVKGALGALDKRTPASLQMTYLLTPPTHKLPALASLLSSFDSVPQRTIVYFSTCAAVDYFAHLLPLVLPSEVVTVSLHGKQIPSVREKNFARFTTNPSPAVLLTTDVAARGLDIQSVDLVVQLDPPSDPKVFLHRCGRAGRAGRKGLSVVLLQPGREEDYVPFLEVRQTPIVPLTNPRINVATLDAPTTNEKIRKHVLKDRALHDKAQRAFVSWVQSYSKHQASSIFRVADLNWPELAKAWALLCLPKMPELKRWDGDRSLGLSIDWKDYAYKDKQREKQRKGALKAKETGEDHNDTPREGQRPKAKVAWSQKLEQKAEREKRRAKKKARRENEREKKLTAPEREEARKTEMMLARLRQGEAPSAIE